MCLLQSSTHRDGSLTVCRYSLGSLKVWTSVISPGGIINLGRLGCPLCPAQKFLILNERHGRHTERMVRDSRLSICVNTLDCWRLASQSQTAH